MEKENCSIARRRPAIDKSRRFRPIRGKSLVVGRELSVPFSLIVIIERRDPAIYQALSFSDILDCGIDETIDRVWSWPRKVRNTYADRTTFYFPHYAKFHFFDVTVQKSHTDILFSQKAERTARKLTNFVEGNGALTLGADAQGVAFRRV
jgi:hypothetical protein